jgi:glycosyltransferase involved in cell wall biosynthesis
MNAQNKALVSVVLPTYNNEASIGRALASVLLQEECDLEVVVVDDCSTDRTPEILAKFASADARVRVVRTQRNSGEGISRTLGIQQAVGQFVAAQDGDDISLAGRLRAQSQYLCDHPDIDWLATWGYAMTPGGQLLSAGDSLTDPESIKRRLFSGQMCVVGASAMVRREALLECHAYRDVPTPDFDLARRFAERYRIAALPSRLYAYVPVLKTKESRRYRQTARLLLRHRWEYGRRGTDARLAWRIVWNAAMGIVPFAPELARYARGARRGAPPVAPPGYETWLRRLAQLEYAVGQGTR